MVMICFAEALENDKRVSDIVTHAIRLGKCHWKLGFELCENIGKVELVWVYC